MFILVFIVYRRLFIKYICTFVHNGIYAVSVRGMEAAVAAFAFSYRERLEDVTSGKPDRYARGRREPLSLAPILKPRQTLDSP